ncbi:hypothetical protein DL766_000146 [Monosporascus sp. MC13-8B]|nr:hypothetical protein DL766_000146 [Monosporascus sp. MC13-8B]
MFFDRFTFDKRYANSPEVSSILCLAAALLIAWFRPPPTEGPSAILTEIFCWLWLSVWFEFLPWSGVPWSFLYTAAANDSKIRLGAIAISIAFAALGKSLDDCRWIEPAVIPALTIIRRRSWPIVLVQSSVAALSILCVKPLFQFYNTVTIAIVTGAASLCFVALVVLYNSLIAVFERRDLLGVGGRNNVETKPIRVISAVVLPLLGLMYWSWIKRDGSPHAIGSSISEGAVKAVQWIFLFQATQNLPWDVAATTGAFSAASYTREQATRNFSVFILKHLFAATAALAQTIFELPASHLKHILWLLVICPLLAIPSHPGHRIASVVGAGWLVAEDVVPGPLSVLPVHRGKHPVEELVQRSRDKFQSMLNNQSRTYEDAEAEYRRRYSIDPPPGFGAWFEFAREKNSPIIDEFDTLFDSIAPFLRMPPASIRRFMDQAMGPGHIARCGFRDGKLTGDCGPRGKTVENMTAPFQHNLPNIDILINALDEPTVLLSPKYDDDAVWDNRCEKDPRRCIAEICGSEWPRLETARHQVSAKLPLSLPFIQDIEGSKDACVHPEYADLHGYYISPPSFQRVRKPVPILSQAKLSVHSDVLMPSQIYLRGYGNLNDYGYVDDAEHDPEWDQKEPKLYWIGSNTGGGDYDSGWHAMHRQRFVALTQDPAETSSVAVVYLNETEPGIWTPWQSGNLLPTLASVHFHAIRLCIWTECKAQMKYFHMIDRQPDEVQYRYKFVMDLDGNSYSGRFYSHLRSRSVSLKMTIFREWHDDRLFPWVHYVPVSLSMKELPEVMRFLATTERGLEISKDIANEGREWWEKALRMEDFQIYFYRLLLELARVLDEERVVI